MFRLVFLLIASFSLANAYELYGVDMKDLSILARHFTNYYANTNTAFTLCYHICISIGLASLFTVSCVSILSKKFKIEITGFPIFMLANSFIFFLAPIESIPILLVIISFMCISYLINKEEFINSIKNPKVGYINGLLIFIFLSFSIFINIVAIY